jgi:hypothetical protein
MGALAYLCDAREFGGAWLFQADRHQTMVADSLRGIFQGLIACASKFKKIPLHRSFSVELE